MAIDRDATIRLLPADGTNWGELVDQAAIFLTDRGHLHWAEDPLELAIHAGLMCRDAHLKSGKPLPSMPTDGWLDELMRTKNERRKVPMDPARQPPLPTMVNWLDVHEASLVLTMECHRRLEKETGDSRTAAALTLAWSMLESGSRACPGQ